MKTLHIARLASGLVWAIGGVLARTGLAGESDALAVGLVAEEGVWCHCVSLISSRLADSSRGSFAVLLAVFGGRARLSF